MRQSIAQWLEDFYSPTLESASLSTKSSDKGNSADPERICITGGASQNLACILQVFTDPVYTQLWMVAPCYFLACRIFEDAGLKTRAVAEGSDGVDLVSLERGLREAERGMVGKVSLSYAAEARESGLYHVKNVCFQADESNSCLIVSLWELSAFFYCILFLYS